MSDPSDKALAQAFRDYVADSGTVGGPMLKFITARARELDAAKGELCGCGRPAEYQTSDGGRCCNKYDIKCKATPPAQAAEAVVEDLVTAIRVMDRPYHLTDGAEHYGFDHGKACAAKLVEKRLRAAIAAIQAGEG